MYVGVIWKGDKLIDGVSETLDWLRSKGKKLVFVTNNSLKSRTQYAKKFHSLGISVAEVCFYGVLLITFVFKSFSCRVFSILE